MHATVYLLEMAVLVTNKHDSVTKLITIIQWPVTSAAVRFHV